MIIDPHDCLRLAPFLEAAMDCRIRTASNQDKFPDKIFVSEEMSDHFGIGPGSVMGMDIAIDKSLVGQACYCRRNE